MKRSPIQLLETTLDKVSVAVNNDYDIDGADSKSFEKVTLEFHQACELASDYWGDSEPPDGMRERTFRVQLGVRTSPEDAAKAPYAFELICSGIVACLQPKVSSSLSAKDGALEYGQALLYGVIRENLLSLTSRMQHGARMLPTISFMGDSKQSPAPLVSEVDPPPKIEGGGDRGTSA